MYFKVELHRDVVWFLRHECTDAGREAFSERLKELRSDPIGTSEALADPQMSRYMLRFFRFGGNLAIFEFDRARERIRVRQCRKLCRKRKAPEEPREQGPAP